MSAYNLELLPASVLMTTITSSFNVNEDIPAYTADLKQALDTAAAPLHLIVDATAFSLGMGELIVMLGIITRQTHGGILTKHRGIYGVTLISQNPIVRMGASSLQASQFRVIPISIVGTMEEAVNSGGEERIAFTA